MSQPSKKKAKTSKKASAENPQQRRAVVRRYEESEESEQWYDYESGLPVQKTDHWWYDYYDSSQQTHHLSLLGASGVEGVVTFDKATQRCDVHEIQPYNGTVLLTPLVYRDPNQGTPPIATLEGIFEAAGIPARVADIVTYDVAKNKDVLDVTDTTK